ncbi:recombinase RecT, partial [Faecalibacillus intestinalis]
MPSREELVGGWCEVYRKDREPERVEVSLDEYVCKKKDGTVNAQWSGKPATMIRKVAVAQCLREAFTSEFQ